MTHVEQQFAEAVAAIAAVLKVHGFRKKRLVWTREGDNFVHTIDVQRSHGNSTEQVTFYVNVAAYIPDFDRTIGKSVPADLGKASPQYVVRFEEISDWPSDRVDAARDGALLDHELPDAITQVVKRLDHIDGEEALARALKDEGALLDVNLFAWSCAKGLTTDARDQFTAARNQFGTEERWPRLAAKFDTVAHRYEVALA